MWYVRIEPTTFDFIVRSTNYYTNWPVSMGHRLRYYGFRWFNKTSFWLLNNWNVKVCQNLKSQLLHLLISSFFYVYHHQSSMSGLVMANMMLHYQSYLSMPNVSLIEWNLTEKRKTHFRKASILKLSDNTNKSSNW